MSPSPHSFEFLQPHHNHGGGGDGRNGGPAATSAAAPESTTTTISNSGGANSDPNLFVPAAHPSSNSQLLLLQPHRRRPEHKLSADAAKKPPPPPPPPAKYRECMKNHAASLGGHANDGCGEFMPSGEDGSLEALRCAACGCHRNFHRRETEAEEEDDDEDDEMESSTATAAGALLDPFRIGGAGAGGGHGAHPLGGVRKRNGGANLAPNLGMEIYPTMPMPLALPYHPAAALPIRPVMTFGAAHPSMVVDEYNGAPPHLHHHNHRRRRMAAVAPTPELSPKKRFRTKFTAAQKEEMGAFAEKVGWRIQKHDEEAVQRFCAQVGVKRHVLKVWMHNNRNTFGKKPPAAAAGAVPGAPPMIMTTTMSESDEMREDHEEDGEDDEDEDDDDDEAAA